MFKKLICLFMAVFIAFSSVAVLAEESEKTESNIVSAPEEAKTSKAADYAIGLGAFEIYEPSVQMSIKSMVKAMSVLTGTEVPIREYLGANDVAPVKRVTALAIALDVLGYSIFFDDGVIDEEDEAEIISVAGKYDISDAISSDVQGVITMGETAELIYNVLTSKIFEITYGENKIHSAKLSDKTYMEEAMKINEISGVVNSTSYSSVIDTEGTLDDRIVIGDVTYSGEEGKFEAFIGRRVDALVKNVDGTLFVVAMHDSSEKVVEISARDLVYSQIKKNSVTYWKTDAKKETLILSPMVDVLYNNTLLKDYSEEDIKIKQGSIVLIDNKGDSGFDTVLIKKHTSFIVYGVSENTGVISDLYGVKYNIGDLIKYGYPIIQNGNKVELQNIEAYSVATCYINKNGQIISLELTNNIAGGTLNKLEEDKNIATIEGKEYVYTEEIKAKLEALPTGTLVTAYLNIFNEIAHFEISAEAYLYGYLTGYTEPEPITQARVKIFTQASEFRIYEARESIKFNGTKMSSEDVFGKNLKNDLWDGKAIKPQLIKYKTNSKGELLEVYTSTEDEDEDPNRLKLNRAGTFCFYSGPMTICPSVRLRTTSKVFKVPLDPTAEKGYEYGAYSILPDDGIGRETFIYDVDSSAYAGAVVVRWDHENLDVTMDQLAAPVYQVESSGEFINNDGDMSVFVTARALGDNPTMHEFKFVKPEVFIITPGQLPDIGQYNAKHLKRGDIIQVTENSNREYAALAIRFKIDGNMPYYEIMKGMAPYIVQSQDRYYGSNNSHSYGVVKKVIEDGYLVNNQMGSLQNDPLWNRVITTKHYTSVWICENNGDDIYKGSVADIKEGDKIYSFLVGLTPKEIVIFR